MARFLVDANVLSEATRAVPDPLVVDWLRRNERLLAVDPVILGEIRFGTPTLATRNVHDFSECGLTVVIPFDSSPIPQHRSSERQQPS